MSFGGMLNIFEIYSYGKDDIIIVREKKDKLE